MKMQTIMVSKIYCKKTKHRETRQDDEERDVIFLERTHTNTYRLDDGGLIIKPMMVELFALHQNTHTQTYRMLVFDASLLFGVTGSHLIECVCVCAKMS